MELLKLKEAMSTSASSRSKRKKQLQQRVLAANHSAGEPCCSKDVIKDFLAFPLGNSVSTRAVTTTSTCVFSRSPAITIIPQPVTSKVDFIHAKPILNVGAKNFVPKQRVLVNQDETLSASRSYASAQSLPVGSVLLGNVNTSMVQSDSIALETIKGLSTAIREGMTLLKRNLPTSDVVETVTSETETETETWLRFRDETETLS